LNRPLKWHKQAAIEKYDIAPRIFKQKVVKYNCKKLAELIEGASICILFLQYKVLFKENTSLFQNNFI
jgi:hypothetical protein